MPYKVDDYIQYTKGTGTSQVTSNGTITGILDDGNFRVHPDGMKSGDTIIVTPNQIDGHVTRTTRLSA
ncbi:hypothetical protein BDZ91DRAFT_848990 [Kalaharituber pfeilii]|nr:hypothetical protein BDZ91DRAFT_848990 [Kalaharituber pfeilii]